MRGLGPCLDILEDCARKEEHLYRILICKETNWCSIYANEWKYRCQNCEIILMEVPTVQLAHPSPAAFIAVLSLHSTPLL